MDRRDYSTAAIDVWSAAGRHDMAACAFAEVDHARTNGMSISDVGNIDLEERDYDVVTGTYRYYRRQRRSRGAHMNLLDHGEIVLSNRDGVIMGMGITTLLKGVMMTGLGGFLLALLGISNIFLTLLGPMQPYVMPVINETQKWLAWAEKMGVPVHTLEEKLLNRMEKYFSVPKKIYHYGLLTVLGRGAGSFWLSSACFGLAAYGLPSMMDKAMLMGSGAMLLYDSGRKLMQDVTVYNIINHPMEVMQRTQATVRAYEARVMEKAPEPVKQGMRTVEQGIANIPAPQMLQIEKAVATYGGPLLQQMLATVRQLPPLDVGKIAGALEQIHVSDVVNAPEKLRAAGASMAQKPLPELMPDMSMFANLADEFNSYARQSQQVVR